MPKLETNEDLFRDLMTYSPYGGLAQAFMKIALEKYCEMVLADKSDDWNDSLISKEAWQCIAKDIQERMNKFYKRERAMDDGVEYESNPAEEGGMGEI